MTDYRRVKSKKSMRQTGANTPDRKDNSDSHSRVVGRGIETGKNELKIVSVGGVNKSSQSNQDKVNKSLLIAGAAIGGAMLLLST